MSYNLAEVEDEVPDATLKIITHLYQQATMKSYKSLRLGRKVKLAAIALLAVSFIGNPTKSTLDY